MAITRVDVGQADYATNTTTFSATLPGSIQPGDVVLFTLTTTSSTATTLTPGASTGSLFASGTGTTDAVQSQGWYYVIPGTVPAAITVTAAAARQGTLGWTAYRGVDTSTPMDAAPSALAQSVTSSPTGVMPSITTTTAGAMVVGGTSHGSSSTTVTPPSPWVLLVDGTRRNGFIYEKGVQASPGATGTSSFTFSGAQQHRMWVAALRQTAGPVAPTLVYNVTGAPSATGFKVRTKTADASSARVKVGTNEAVTTGVVYGTAGTPDASGWSESVVTGLSAGTKYYYAVELTGAETVTTVKVGEAKTLPTNGTIRIAFGSCHDLGNQGSTDVAYTRALTRDPDMFWSLGDTPYSDTLSTSQATQLGFLETQLASIAGWRQILAGVPTVYIKSDHDSSDNDSGTGAWTAPNRAAYLQAFPTIDRPDPSGLYGTLELGSRVLFIFTDSRYFCTASTKLGATQLAWLKGQFEREHPVKIWVQDGTWLDDRAPDPVDDTWAFYASERAEIGAHWAANGAGTLISAHGDQHAISADDGSGNPWGGFPTVCAAPFRNNASHKTGNPGSDWSQGIWPTTAGAVVNQYGMLDLTDTGSQITVAFRGYDSSDVQRVALDVVVPTETPSGASTAGVTVSVSGAGSRRASGASTSGAGVTVAGVGSKRASAASTTGAGVSVAGAGSKAVTAASTVPLAVSVAGAGVKRGQGATAEGVTVSTVGSGQRVQAGQGASTVGVELTASGVGVKVARGASIATVGTTAHGAGVPVQDGTGASVSTATVQATGAGYAIRTGSGIHTVHVTTYGSGRNPAGPDDVELTIARGPYGHPFRVGSPRGNPFTVSSPRRQA